MKRISIVMGDTKVALKNQAENLIKAALILIDEDTATDVDRKKEYLRSLSNFLKELYIENLIPLPEENDSNHYENIYFLMKLHLLCRKKLALMEI